jgi:hypothetical protein
LVGAVEVVPDEVGRGPKAAARACKFSVGGAAVSGDGEHASTQRCGIRSVNPKSDTAGLIGCVAKEGIGDGGLAAAAQAVEYVDAVTDARLDSGSQAIHLPGTVAEYDGSAADCWVTYRVGPRPVWRVMMMLDDVLVAGRLIDTPMPIGLCVVSAVHR